MLIVKIYLKKRFFNSIIDEYKYIIKELFEQINEMYPDEYIASVAVGIAEYDRKKYSCFDDIFKRADEIMYENKQEIKSNHENAWMKR